LNTARDEVPTRDPTRHRTIVAGGACLIAGALAFVAVFAFLAARFDYPAVLDGHPQDVLPALLATGSTGRAAWAFYSVLPLVFIPAGAGAFEALRDRAPAVMRLAAGFAFLSAIAMILGLMRWPSLHWELAQAWDSADASSRQAIAAVFDGANSFLGNFVGEFVGELGFSMFFLLSGLCLLRDPRARSWFAWWGVATGALGLVGMWRNVTPAVALVADINNYLLPAWMLGFGVWLLRVKTSE
jgi:hypothetical protein